MARKIRSNGPSAEFNGIQVNHKSADPNKSYGQGLNKFNNSYDQAFTLRYADIHPFAVLDCNERDDIPFRSDHDLGTYTLQSPLKSEVNMHKTVALVPYQAILPNTWKRIYVNPTKGDDVPEDAFCDLNLVAAWKAYRNYVIDTYATLADDPQARFQLLIEFLIATESIFSAGSLLSAFKMNFHSFFTQAFDNDSTSDDSFDSNYKNVTPADLLMDLQFGLLFGDQYPFNVGISIYKQDPDGSPIRLTTLYKAPDYDFTSQYQVVSPHVMLDYLRDRNYDSISTGLNGPDFIDPSPILDSMLSSITSLTIPLDGYYTSLERPIAYQMAVAKFMSDDSIDNIFDASTFRNNFSALMDYGDFFEWNGQPFIYDIFSRHNLEKAFKPETFADACSLLFGFRKSLKYGDYFISSRPNAYAVGDVNAPVINNFVSAIDITQSISEQRFTNWNNRTGMSYEEYVKGLTGATVMPDITEPLFVSHEVFKLSGFEVENTGAAQLESGTNSVTTLLRSSKSDWMFDIGITDVCVLVGLAHFDMKRLYTRTMDRAVMKKNRFDFFNKFFQYTGDQDIKHIELDAAHEESAVFSYITRYMQYKQQVSHAGGGFLGPLRSWANVAQNSRDFVNYGRINSDFIRNSNGDFDIFYGSLTGYSLGTYFHFAVYFHNDFSEMRRAMDIAPDIL